MTGTGQPGSAVSSSVEVGVDPGTAFTAFTEEVDLWWVRGPINHHAGGRMRAMRCEPGVGGRLLEVYDDATGDALQLARITAWEPGQRLAWQSSIDDVETEVSFEASGAGTLVTVTARVPAGGQDRGGTSWVRVVPKWFGPWCARRDGAPRAVTDLARLALGVSYARPAAAARWLAGAFGFEPASPLPEGPDPLPDGPYGHPWIEFRVGNSSLMVFRLAGDAGAGPAQVHQPWVYVTDIEAHYRRAAAAGAAIIEELASPWGLPMYVAADPEGQRWTFAQARPTM
ncbi:MAG TPA: VOC family protein [Streptosporangiaceae bacterium]|jgi:uncharacterized glyoxalase superfamily protein PhnB